MSGIDWSKMISAEAPAWAAKPMTIADLAAAMAKLPPPPPPADPHRCINCKEAMSEPAMGVGGLPGIFSTPSAYICGRCAVIVKREFHYKPREAALVAARAAEEK